MNDHVCFVTCFVTMDYQRLPKTRLTDPEAGGDRYAATENPQSKDSLQHLILPIAISLFIILLTLRINIVLRRPKPPRKSPNAVSHLMIVLGSGGHTAEMFSILRNLDTSRYAYRTYIVSSGDDFSAGLARDFEARLAAREHDRNLQESFGRMITIPRARKIHQSLLSTPWSCLLCLAACLRVLPLAWPVPQQGDLTKEQWDALVQRRPKIGLPDAILTNGPATGVIVVVAAYVLRFLGRSGSRDRLRVIYVESWARVRRLSLSGKIMLRLADRFIVQWEALLPATRGRGEYIGVLVE